MIAQHRSRFLRHLVFVFLVGLPFRLVLAILRSSALLIDSYIPLDAPRREDFLPSPLLAANAAPAAICCFFDFAGIQFSSCCFWICPFESFPSLKWLLTSSNKAMQGDAFYSQLFSPSAPRKTDFQIYRLSISFRRSSFDLPSLC